MKSVLYRRKREGRTDYNKRLRLLVSREKRIVIRKSLRSIQIQVVEYLPDGDKVLTATHSRELVKYGLKNGIVNIPVSYLTGLLAGKKLLKQGIKTGVVDLGLQRAHVGGNLFAVIKGLVDAGVSIAFDESVAPSEERLNGEHLTSDLKEKLSSVKDKILAE